MGKKFMYYLMNLLLISFFINVISLFLSGYETILIDSLMLNVILYLLIKIVLKVIEIIKYNYE